jgi:hypothetical protein
VWLQSMGWQKVCYTSQAQLVHSWWAEVVKQDTYQRDVTPPRLARRKSWGRTAEQEGSRRASATAGLVCTILAAVP